MRFDSPALRLPKFRPWSVRDLIFRSLRLQERWPSHSMRTRTHSQISSLLYNPHTIRYSQTREHSNRRTRGQDERDSVYGRRSS